MLLDSTPMPMISKSEEKKFKYTTAPRLSNHGHILCKCYILMFEQ